MKQIFISYTARDRDYGANLREHLTRNGYKVWSNRGQNWQYAVVEAIKESAAVVVILSANAADSSAITYEWAMALGAGIKVIPVIFRGVEGHPHLMVQEQFDFGSYPDEEMFWKMFVRELQRLLGDGGKQETEALLASPSSSAMGFYLIVDIRGHGSKRYPLREESISLGREASNDIQIDDGGVSRVHLRLVRLRNGGYQALDMGSTNGTFIGEDRIEMQELKAGDLLRIGDKITLKYEYVP